MNLFTPEFRPTRYESYGLSGGYFIRFESPDGSLGCDTEQTGNGGCNTYHGNRDELIKWLSDNENVIVELNTDMGVGDPFDMASSMNSAIVNKEPEWEDVAVMTIANAIEMKRITL